MRQARETRRLGLRLLLALIATIALGGCGQSRLDGTYSSERLPEFGQATVKIGGGKLKALMTMRTRPVYVSHEGAIKAARKLADGSWQLEGTIRIRTNAGRATAPADVATLCLWHKGATRDEDGLEYRIGRVSLTLKRSAD